MVYIYEENNEIKYVRDIKPQAEKIIVLDKMIPIPNKEGYHSILRANFNTNDVWYELIETEEHKKDKAIKELKEQLNATDYKIIKASEYNLLGLECEYDIQELHTERQRIRNRINELEGSN